MLFPRKTSSVYCYPFIWLLLSFHLFPFNCREPQLSPQLPPVFVSQRIVLIFKPQLSPQLPPVFVSQRIVLICKPQLAPQLPPVFASLCIGPDRRVIYAVPHLLFRLTELAVISASARVA